MNFYPMIMTYKITKNEWYGVVFFKAAYLCRNSAVRFIKYRKHKYTFIH